MKNQDIIKVSECRMTIDQIIKMPEDEVIKLNNYQTAYDLYVQPKLNTADINIIMPLKFKLIFDICAGGDPGYIQVMVKDFLMQIKNNFKDKKYPDNYTISLFDYFSVYAFEHPPIIEEDEEYFKNLYKQQKIKNQRYLSPDNKCDTLEYWREIIL